MTLKEDIDFLDFDQALSFGTIAAKKKKNSLEWVYKYLQTQLSFIDALRGCLPNL